MHVIVDCQVLQTSDSKRGMGLYIRSLCRSLCHRETGHIQWTFLTNTRLPSLSHEDAHFIKELGGDQVRVALQYQADSPTFVGAADTNRQKIDAAIQPLLQHALKDKVIFFVPAMFCREIYPVFPTTGTTNMMLFHDVIPFLYHQEYFRDPDGLPRKDYAQRFREVYRTDFFVTNSQTTADDLTVFFGVDPSRVKAIFGAAADRTGMKAKAPTVAKMLRSGFVFMPSGDDFRKNNALAVQAFAELNRSERLVIASSFSQGTKQALKAICPDIVFAGSVTDEEFLWLLRESRAVFFPTLYEGLGMPVLEAVEQQAKVICSRIPVFAELSEDAFFYCDPLSPTSMAQALNTALDDNAGEWSRKREHYNAILNQFSWQKTATLFLEALMEVTPAPLNRLKLAIFCPSPSSYSSVGKYAFEVHAELSRYYDIDYYVGEGQTAFEPTRPNILEYAANYYAAATFSPNRVTYDHVLYNIGNSEFHVEGILDALRYPGYMIVHDTRLNGIFDYMQHWGFMTPERRQFEARLDEAFKCELSSCLASLATNQEGIFCHSSYAQKAIKEVVSVNASHIWQIVHPIGVPGIVVRQPGKAVISFAGIISEDKGINLVADVAQLPDVDVRVFGFGILGDSPLLAGLRENVSIMNDLTDKDFQDALRASDIVVNYRPNYHGETSRSTLEAMRYGAVVIVKNVGWYSELPDEVVIKVENEVAVLDAIRSLIDNPTRRQEIGAAARQYLAEHYSYGQYAQTLAVAMGEQ